MTLPMSNEEFETLALSPLPNKYRLHWTGKPITTAHEFREEVVWSTQLDLLNKGDDSNEKPVNCSEYCHQQRERRKPWL